MTPFFAYLIKSSISLVVLYCLFRFVMRNEKNHTLNRFLLLGILFLSAVIPFLNIQFFYEEIAIQQVEDFREFVSVPVFVDVSPQEIIMPVQEISSFSINPWLAFYLMVITVLLFRIVFGVVRVTKIIGQAEKRRLQKIVLAVVKDLIQPFTFLNKVVLSEKDFTENKDIVVAHEHAHIKQMHAIDLMVCELFTIVHFFNPFMWLLRRDLKLIHEYQADQAVLNKGIDAKKYQLLVLQKSVGERRFAMANHFTQKPILKRLKMMQKRKIGNLSGFKAILFVPLLVLLLMAFSEKSENVLRNTIAVEKVTAVVESIPLQTEYEGFFIELRKDGNYIDNTSCSLEQVVTKAKTFQKTGREDMLLVLDEDIPYKRVDEVRLALSKAKVYHVNQTTRGSNEIIYPHGDVTKRARYAQGSWHHWFGSQLKAHKDIPEDWEYRITYSFIVDKNGKVRDGHVMEGCQYAEINEAYTKILANIPDWKPAVKGSEVVSVYSKYMDGRRTKTSVVQSK